MRYVDCDAGVEGGCDSIGTPWLSIPATALVYTPSPPKPLMLPISNPPSRPAS